MFRSITDIILPFLKELFNEIFNTGDFPDEWGKSIITPVHKTHWSMVTHRLRNERTGFVF